MPAGAPCFRALGERVGIARRCREWKDATGASGAEAEMRTLWSSSMAGRLPTEDSSLRNVRAASHRRRGRPGALLLADAELRDHGLVPLGIVFLEVVEQATPLADQHE
jgi:hypothetical protein